MEPKTADPDQPASPRQRPSAGREILESAIRLFARSEFDAVSLRDITKACGAERSLILYHFQSKERLWQSAMREIVSRFEAALAAGRAPDADASERERLAWGLQSYFNALAIVPEYAQVLVREGVAESPRLDWIVENFSPELPVAFRVSDPRIKARMRLEVVRDIIFGSSLATSALKPLVRASNTAARRKNPAETDRGDTSARDLMVQFLTNLILGDLEATPI